MRTNSRRRMAAKHSQSEILEAAERRFSSLGYERTRLEDIAKDIGIGRSGVLYHFPNKKRLYRAVLDSVYGGFMEQASRIIAGSGTLVERIEALVVMTIAEISERPSIARIALREAAASDPDRVREIRAQAKPLLVLLQLIFEEGEKNGELNPVDTDPYFLISALSGTVMFYVAALPVFFEELPEDHLGQERFEVLQRNIMKITRQMLGIEREK